MKLTFLLRLFVLGFFSDVVLTSPLVARQNELKKCDDNKWYQCSITIKPPDIAYEKFIEISTKCAEYNPANCTLNNSQDYYIRSPGYCEAIEAYYLENSGCIIENQLMSNVFNCTGFYGDEERCGFTCNNCTYNHAEGILNCQNCP